MPGYTRPSDAVSPTACRVLEFVVDEKIARAAVPGCRDVADCMDHLASSNSIHSSYDPQNFVAMVRACHEFGSYGSPPAPR